MLNHSRRMQEFCIAKGRYMQVYMDDPSIGVVAFFDGARASVDTVPEFASYQTTFDVCAFYKMPYPVIEEYLKTVGI